LPLPLLAGLLARLAVRAAGHDIAR
jgi:hypothetical protein